MKVKPAEGRAVRDPRTMALLTDDGREVPDGDPFWVRRVRDGDVVVEGGEPAAAEHDPHAHQAQRHRPSREA